ncbi:MAG: hypothetical protein AAF772_10290 [Acidobacteriota bacterium]
MIRFSRVRLVPAALCAVALLALPVSADDRPVHKVTAELVGDVVYPHIFEGDLRNLPKAPTWQPGDPIKVVPKRGGGLALDGDLIVRPPRQNDPLVDRDARGLGTVDPAFGTPSLNFEGQGFNGVNPPDPSGEVGIDYYIQMINAGGGATFAIYNKSDGSLAAGPTALDSLGTGNCASGLGDPIVLFDEAAERWFISEFSNVADALCIYISQTPDPVTGGWYAYEFGTPNFPDYPKYGVWIDSYLATTNESAGFFGPSEPSVYAMDRENMLMGNPARPIQRFPLPTTLSAFGFQAATPADIDGAMEPAPGSPAIIMRHNDDEAHSPGSADPSTDALEIFELTVDWATPGNSVLTGSTSIAIADFSSDLCGFTTFSCIPQPGGGTPLDPLREVVMFQLQYRNFGADGERLVGTLATNTDGQGLRAGKRWFELRRDSNEGVQSPWTLFQEGTISPDADNRFMGSASMDISGNIAVAYSVSSSSTFPSLRYSGRLADDALGTTPQGEFELIAGAGSNSAERYGDYSQLAIDPVDGCTFWFTGEYNPSSSWATRIAAFAFDACGVTDEVFQDGFESADTSGWSGTTSGI